MSNVGEIVKGKLVIPEYARGGSKGGTPFLYGQGSEEDDYSFLSYVKDYADEHNWLGNDIDGDGYHIEYLGKWTFVLYGRIRSKEYYYSSVGLAGSSDTSSNRDNFKFFYYHRYNKFYCTYSTYSSSVNNGNISYEFNENEEYEYHLFVAVYDWPNKTYKLYVDGIVVDELDLDGRKPMSLRWNATFYIGSIGLSHYWAWKGGSEIKFVQFYLDALTEDEIRSIGKEGNWISGKDGAYWNANDISDGADIWKDRIHGFELHKYQNPSIVKDVEKEDRAGLVFKDGDYIEINEIEYSENDAWTFITYMNWFDTNGLNYTFYVGHNSVDRLLGLKNNKQYIFLFRDIDKVYHNISVISSDEIINKDALVSWSSDGSGNLKFSISYGNSIVTETMTSIDTSIIFKYIGSGYSLFDYSFTGKIYNVMLFNRALSDEEIKQVYNYVVNGEGSMITDGLVLWLDGDSIGDDGVWYDKSGNGNHGTIYGARKISNINPNL